MKNKILGQEFCLTAYDIDRISETVDTYFKEKSIDRKELLRLRISMENVLLNWQESLGSEHKVYLSIFTRFGKHCVELQCSGGRHDPFANEDDLGDWAKSLRSSLESIPSYEYIKDTNTVFFQIRKPGISRLLLILIFLTLGIAVGFAGFLLPDTLRQSICENVFTPVYETYLNMFSFCGIPLIFLSVLTGILGLGNIHSFTLIGRKMILRFLMTTVLATLTTMAVGLLVFKLDFGGNTLNVQYADFLNMVLGWIPTGIFQPFIDCNAMQLVIMGVIFALAILIFGNRNQHLSGFMFDMNTIMLEFSRWLTALIPFFVFTTIIYSMWQSEVGTLLSAWKSWAATTGMQTATILVMMLIMCKKHKVSLWQMMKKVSKTFLIALGTNSCTASVSANYSSCSNNLGIDEKVYSFGIPVGTTIFKPATAIRLVFLCLFMVTGDNYMPVSGGWLVMLFIMAIVLSVATPAIPGGTLMLCSMLFTQLGIPTSVLTQMLTTDVFFDCVCTAFNQIAVSLSLASYASDIGMIDENKLLAKE